MAASDRLNRAARMLAIVMAASSLAACATKELQPDSAALGKGPVTPGTQRDFTVNVGDLVYFSSDSSDLTPEAQQTLQKQAQWLKQYPQFSVTIECHADERGTREYNIALGARRAQTVREYLTSRGVQAHRMRTISYGKERPIAVCNDLSCWSQNRRGVTVLNTSS